MNTKTYRWSDSDYMFAKSVDEGVWNCLKLAWKHMDDERESNKWFLQADKLEQKYKTDMKDKYGSPHHYLEVLDQCREERGIIANIVVTPECEAMFAPPGKEDRDTYETVYDPNVRTEWTCCWCSECMCGPADPSRPTTIESLP